MSLDDRSFAGPTAVGRYWIAHAEGFAVETPAGRRLGTVAAVALDPRTSETMLVLGRSALRGRRHDAVVPARRVASVLPWSRRIVLTRTAETPAALRRRRNEHVGLLSEWPLRQWLSLPARAVSLAIRLCSRVWSRAVPALKARRAGLSQRTSGRTPGPFATRR